MRIKRKDLKILIENYLNESSKYPYVKDPKKSDEFRAWLLKNEPAVAKKHDVTVPSGSTSFGGLKSAYAEVGDDFENRKVPGMGVQAIRAAAQGFAFIMDPILEGLGSNFITSLFSDFVKMRTMPITAASIDSEIADCLRIIALDAQKNKKVNGSKTWGSSQDYARVATSKAYKERFGGESTGTYNMAKNMQGHKSIIDSLSSQDPLNNLYNTFTHMNIKIDGNQLVITDQYDFNPVVNILGSDEIKGKKVVKDPEFFKQEDNFYKFIGSAAQGNLMIYRGKSWRKSKFLSRESIEHLCRFYHGLFGYKGIPINIKISKKSPHPALKVLWDVGSSLYDQTIGGAVETGYSVGKAIYDFGRDSIFGRDKDA